MEKDVLVTPKFTGEELAVIEWAMAKLIHNYVTSDVQEYAASILKKIQEFENGQES